MADDFNAMQAQLGLTGGGGSLAPFGLPTPQPPVAPVVKHPGELSQDIVRQTQTASMNTVQSAMATRPGAMGGGYATSSDFGGGGFGAVNAYARQYQQNMAGMNSQLFNPYVAQTMSSMSGMGGFTPGMMPSPIQMTPPSMGIFRPFPQKTAPSIPPTPPMPLIPTPFTPNYPPAQFQTPSDYSYQQREQRGFQAQAAALATPGIAARVGTDWAMSHAGAGIGANIGARLAGPRGAGVGSALGALGGFALSEQGGFATAAQNMVDEINPLRSTWMRGAQMRNTSQGFVVGGPGLADNGRGLSMSASMDLSRRLEDVGYSSRFRRETGGQFSNNDLTRITKVSADQGLLDMQQTPEEIVGRVKNIAKTLRTFMRVANEPDIREALKQMGQMNAMGLSLPETVNVMSNARMYAKMAGTSVKGIMESGLSGAMTFQQQGLSAGLGLEMGMGAMGTARQAVAAGAYTQQQLGMLGGVQGIAQREMMGQAATLKSPMMAASMATMSGGGTFGVNRENISALRAGKFDIGQMASMGAQNLSNMASRGGVEALGGFLANQTQIQDRIGRELGPEGMKMMDMRQVMNTMRMMNMSGKNGFLTAAMMGGKTEDEAVQLAGQASSPRYFQNLISQRDVNKREMRSLNEQRSREEAPSILDRWRGMDGAKGTFARAVSGEGSRIRAAGAGIATGISEGVTDFGRALDGQYSSRTPVSLQAGSDEEMRGLLEISQKELAAQPPQSAKSETTDESTNYSSRLNYIKSQGGWRSMSGVSELLAAAPFEATGGTKKEHDDIQAGTNLILLGKSATLADKKGARTRLAKSLGVSEDAIDTMAEKSAGTLAGTAKGKVGVTGLGRGGGLVESDAEQAFTQGTGRKLDASQQRDMAMLTVSRSEALAGVEGSDGYNNLRDMGGQAEEEKSKKTALEQQQVARSDALGKSSDLEKSTLQKLSAGVGRAVTGGAAGLLLGPAGVVAGAAVGFASAFGENTEKEQEMVTALYGAGKNTDVSMLALLEGDQYKAYTDSMKARGIDPDKIDRMKSDADRKRKDLEKKDPANYKNAANRVKSMSAEDQVTFAKKQQKAQGTIKKQFAQDKGFDEIFKNDKELATLAKKDARAALQALVDRGDSIENLGFAESTKKIVEKFSNADEKDKEAIVNEFGNQSQMLGAKADGPRGGAASVTDSKNDKSQQDIAAMSAEAAATFKGAVADFARAVGSRYGDPSMNDGVNNSDDWIHSR